MGPKGDFENQVMTVLFWFFLTLILYCYFGYPLLAAFTARRLRRLPRKGHYEPAVSIVLSVWNEEGVIEQKIENLLSLDYPPEKIEILIGSDGSTDRTNDIIKRFGDPRIRLIESPARRGKAATLNVLAGEAKSEIIVFTDARQAFEEDAVKALAANFADPGIGCVSGELIFSKRGGATARGINLYWNYEKWIRRAESGIHSMLGATGAIYAVRRKLFSAIPDDIVLDDVFVPFKIIQKGYRAVFDPSARAYDEAADSPGEEHRRKARTLFGNYQIFRMFPGMFNPLKSPIAIQLFSHKFLRVAAPFFMAVVFFVNWRLAGDVFYAVLFAFQIVFYGMAVAGGLARHQRRGILGVVSRICYIPYVFCLLNFSALAGFLRFAGAKQKITWEKARDKRHMTHDT